MRDNYFIPCAKSKPRSGLLVGKMTTRTKRNAASNNDLNTPKKAKLIGEEIEAVQTATGGKKKGKGICKYKLKTGLASSGLSVIKLTVELLT